MCWYKSEDSLHDFTSPFYHSFIDALGDKHLESNFNIAVNLVIIGSFLGIISDCFFILALDNTIAFINNNCAEAYSEEFITFKKILSKEIINVNEDKIKSTGYVIDTLEAVLWTFFHTEGYRDTILKAINLGGDTDTLAAITGGIAGIYYGLNDIPKEWLQSIAKKEELYRMFKQFLDVINL